jgi:hypothetical protein
MSKSKNKNKIFKGTIEEIRIEYLLSTIIMEMRIWGRVI